VADQDKIEEIEAERERRLAPENRPEHSEIDNTGKTIVSASSLRADRPSEGGKSASATQIGETLATLCKEKGITKVVFDRNGYIYHGRVRALADGARKGGLEF